MGNVANAQWRNISTQEGLRVNEITFPSRDVAYSYMDRGSGQQLLYKSTDAGLSWTKISSDTIVFKNSNLHNLSFVNEDIGFIAFAKFSPRRSTYLYKTKDGGNSWDSIGPGATQNGSGVARVNFPSEQVGYYATANKVFSTKNGGSSWKTKTLAGFSYGGVKDMDFYDNDYGIVGAWDGSFAYKGAIYTTSNGGNTWDSLVFDSSNTSIGKVQQVSNNLAIAMEENNWFYGQRIYKTFNQGASWDTVTLSFLKDSSDNASDFYFRDPKIGYLATTKGYIYMTIDGGKTWSISHKEKFGLTLLESNGTTMYSAGTVNVFVVEDKDLSIGRPVEDIRIMAYPNPVSRSGQVYFTGNIHGEVFLTSYTGKLLCKGSLQRGEAINLDAMNLSAGLYFLTISGEQVQTVKLVVD
tara:strand:+ start:16350 stop:17579 length:1230 start_codon:yes stop_codon:yes gene_type:complete